MPRDSSPDGVDWVFGYLPAGANSVDGVAGVRSQELLVQGGQTGQGFERAAISGGEISGRVHKEDAATVNLTQASAFAVQRLGPHGDAHFLGNGQQLVKLRSGIHEPPTLQVSPPPAPISK
jgi:hypothetical protein